MALCFNADRKILHPGDQFQSLGNSAIHHVESLMDVAGDTRARAVSRPRAWSLQSDLSPLKPMTLE